MTGVSGSGKTTMVLESLVPGLQAVTSGGKLPAYVKAIQAEGISHVKLIDTTPIGINVRSTVATYANVHDELREGLCQNSRCEKMPVIRQVISPIIPEHYVCPVCDGTSETQSGCTVFA